MGTKVDYTVLFAFQKQILASEKLTAEDKIKMISEAIKEAEGGERKQTDKK